MQEPLRMIRILSAIWIVAMLVLGLAMPLLASPNARDCSAGNATILAPQTGATVSGIVQIEGTASLGSEFQYYKIEVAPVGTEAWGDLAGEAREQVVNGQLAVWDSASAPDGAYTIRLRVVDPTGNYCETSVTNILVQNSRPTEVPTAPEAPTPAETEAPPIQNAVPTPVPTTPVPEGTGTPGATVTPPRAVPSRTPEPGSGGIGGIEIAQVIGAVTDVFAALGRILIFGAVAMAGIFLVVGVVYFVRRVL